MLPLEIVRRGIVLGYSAVAITDHAGPGNARSIIEVLARDAELANRYWGFPLVAGVEITHVPAAAIDEVARNAKFDGAKLVVVHGETPLEPVEPGTNHAAVQSPHVDILAHAGPLTAEDARLAAAAGVYIELSAHPAHRPLNAALVRVGRPQGVAFLVNSDAHHGDGMLTEERAAEVAREAGLPEDDMEAVLHGHPMALLTRLGFVL